MMFRLDTERSDIGLIIFSDRLEGWDMIQPRLDRWERSQSGRRW